MAEPHATLRLVGPVVDRDEVIVPPVGMDIGRGGRNDLVINDPKISKLHTRLFWQDDRLWAEDRDSTNGTYVNDYRLTPNTPAPVSVGDVIRMGPYFLIVEDISLAPVMEAAQPAPQPYLQVVEEVLAGLLQPPRPSDMPEVFYSNSSSRVIHAPDDPYPLGIPRPPDVSTWLQYLPAIFSAPDFGGFTDHVEANFIGRYLLIFESILTPIIWKIDNFDLYLTPETMTHEWVEWVAGWFDLLLPQWALEREQRTPERQRWLLERQQAILRNAHTLFRRRGTKGGLADLLRLFFNVEPQIIEYPDEFRFVVRLPLGKDAGGFSEESIRRLIDSQKPAFTTFDLEIT